MAKIKADKARKWTDKQLAEMERRLTVIYTEAEAGIRQKWDAYLKQLEASIPQKEKEVELAVKSGDPERIKNAKARLKDALMQDTLMSKKYRDMVAQTAAKLSDVNSIALAYLNGEMPPVYIQNYNGIGKDIETAVKGYSFDLVDENTVKELTLKGDKLLLPPKKMDIPKDKWWNVRNINAQVLQGILQGDSIPKIADRMQIVTDMNRKSAIRNARTMVTAAENRGRLAGMERAENDGIVIKKTWMSTHDSRTRESHQMLDGESVNVNDNFSNGLEYPGDPKGEASEVYNCRCTMVTEIIGFRRVDGSISKVGDIERYEPTYFDNEQGENEKKDIEKSADNGIIELTKLKQGMSESDYQEYIKLLNENENRNIRELYNKYGDTLSKVEMVSGGGAYSPKYKSIVFDKVKERNVNNGMSVFSTLAHEYGHAFDNLGNFEGLSYNEVDTLNSKVVIGSGITKAFNRVPSSSDEFLSAIRKDKENIRKIFLSSKADILSTDASSGVQDAIEGMFGQKNAGLRWGHGDAYYNRQYNKWIKQFGKQKELKEAYTELGIDASNQTKAQSQCRIYETASEAWANILSAETCGGKELEYTKKYLPNSYQVLMEIIEKAR